MELAQKPFELGKLVDDVKLMLQPTAADKKIHLLINSSFVKDIWVSGDENRLKQVLINLVGNAIKFTDESEVQIRLAGSQSRHTTENIDIHIEVQDSGCGIPVAALPTLFEKFTQLERSSTNQKKGTGLGLAIAAGLCELMGSMLRVESSQGTGTRFFFTVSLPEISPPIDSKQSAPYEILALTILAAEDNPVNQMVMEQMLVDLGHKLILVTNGKAADDSLSLINRPRWFRSEHPAQIKKRRKQLTRSLPRRHILLYLIVKTR